MKVSPLTKPERHLIETVLKFAEMKAIRSTSQVEGPFLEAARRLGSRSFSTIPPDSLYGYVNDQAILRGWIDRMLKPRRTAKERLQLADEVIQWTNEAQSRLVASIVDGRQRWVADVQFNGVHALIGYALWLLLDEDSGRLKLLGRCAAPKCQMLFLRKRPDTKFHDPREGAVIRVQRFRKEHP